MHAHACIIASSVHRTLTRPPAYVTAPELVLAFSCHEAPPVHRVRKSYTAPSIAS